MEINYKLGEGVISLMSNHMFSVYSIKIKWSNIWWVYHSIYESMSWA